MRYPYILFDLDGTLTRSGEGILRSIEFALSEMGLKSPGEEEVTVTRK